MRLPASPLAAGCCDDPVKDTWAPSPKHTNFPPATPYGQAPGSSSLLLSPQGVSSAATEREVLFLLRQPGLWLEGPVVVTELQLSAPDGSLYSHMGSTRGPGVSVAQARTAQSRQQSQAPNSLSTQPHPSHWVLSFLRRACVVRGQQAGILSGPHQHGASG